MAKTKVYIYAACNIMYGSYYVEGVKQFFNNKNIYFSTSVFPAFNDDLFALIITDKKNIQKRLIIDYHDATKVNLHALEWCDLYGKINLESTYHSLLLHEKIVAIGPGFGIRVWNLYETIFYGISNLIKSVRVLKDRRRFISNYKQQLFRQPVKAYTSGVAEKDYIFTLNSIWKRSAGTNDNRLRFIKACKRIPGIRFEGGFAPRQNKDIDNFNEYTTSKWYSSEEYLTKVKKSAIVFNTPAVLDCHGWKLGEFLAMGKAIASTPLSRLMPGSFTDRKHIYLIDADSDYEKEINALLENDTERKNLEINARKYYEEYLCPKQVIAKMIEKLNLSV